MSQILIRRATMSDARQLGPRLRVGDSVGAQAAGMGGVEAVEVSLSVSSEAWAAEYDGKVICAWGYAALGLFSEAELWLITAPEVEHHKRLFLRLNQEFLASILEHHTSAICHVHCEYHKSARWLAWLGFHQTGRVMVNGAEFFEMRLWRN